MLNTEEDKNLNDVVNKNKKAPLVWAVTNKRELHLKKKKKGHTLMVKNRPHGHQCGTYHYVVYQYNAAALKANHYYDALVDSQFLHEAMDAVNTLGQLRCFVQAKKRIALVETLV
jgi:hypothetical protein